MMKAGVLLVFFVAAVAARTETDTLDGFQVLAVTAVTPTQFDFLKKLIVENVELDFWTAPKYQRVTDIMVSPEQKQLLIGQLAERGIKWSVKMQDVGRMVAEEKAANDAALLKSSGRMNWEAYQNYATIVEWLESIESDSGPGAVVTLSVIGKSFEGRDIHMVKISTGPLTGDVLKPVVFIDAHLHAREWVSGAVATWIINELIAAIPPIILAKYDFFIVPLVNPDGYEHSKRPGARMWRKTRSIHPSSVCLGVDPNRNWAFHFGGEGTSPDPCSEIYRGEKAFSELETDAIQKAIKGIQAEPLRNLHAYYTLHSYSQMWLLSWGYTKFEYPPDYDSHLEPWANASVAAIEASDGRVYKYGTGADILYGVGGASDDWAKNEGVKYVATLEVRDSEDGQYGFLLPPDQIIPTAEEIWAGLQLIADDRWDATP